jgi:Cd(II)/Pb(II)-responsive transcriptional regulator
VKIGQLAQVTDCEIETIRYYEREGLMESPARMPSGYRSYAVRHVQQLQFVRHCRSLGLPLAEIKLILAFKYRPELGCAEINSLLDRQLERAKAQIKALKALEKQLRDLRSSCTEQRSAYECGILLALKAASEGRPCECHA